jgi:DNA-binding transcriptional LysR family regulator
MGRILDIAPLRSFVAVADAGGFQRAADALCLSQGAVSHHVRRLETAIGHPLVERHGRGFRFTPDGEKLLDDARRILALHDEVLQSFTQETIPTLVIGATEHAAALLLPALAGSLDRAFPRYRVTFRIDRGTKLREAFSAGRVDLALLLGSADDPRACGVGDLRLSWFSTTGWTRPSPPRPLPVVVFGAPSTLRTRALQTLADHSVSVIIRAEATQLAGVHAAVAAGLGVALLPALGPPPDGFAVREDLPPADAIPLSLWARPETPPAISRHVTDTLQRLLAPAWPRPAPQLRSTG